MYLVFQPGEIQKGTRQASHPTPTPATAAGLQGVCLLHFFPTGLISPNLTTQTETGFFPLVLSARHCADTGLKGEFWNHQLSLTVEFDLRN